jgi:hypothetical protein
MSEFNSAVSEIGSASLVTPDGNLAVVGTRIITTIPMAAEGFLMKINQSGSQIFLFKYIPAFFQSSSLNAAMITNNNTILMVGSAIGPASSLSHLYIVNADLNGMSGCNQTNLNFTYQAWIHLVLEVL